MNKAEKRFWKLAKKRSWSKLEYDRGADRYEVSYANTSNSAEGKGVYGKTRKEAFETALQFLENQV